MKRRERSLSEGGDPALSNEKASVLGGSVAEPSLVNVESSGGRAGGSASGGIRRKMGIPLSRTISGTSSSSRRGGESSSTLASIASFLKPKSHPNSSAFSIGTHHARSRDLISSSSTLGYPSTPPSGASQQQSPPSTSSLTFLSPPPPPIHRSSTFSARHPRQKTVTMDRGRLPYRVMEHPRPTGGFRLYPNWTPGGEDTRRRPDGERVGWWERGGGGGGGEEAVDEDEEDEEWPEVLGTKSWVGPLLFVPFFFSLLPSPKETYFQSSRY